MSGKKYISSFCPKEIDEMVKVRKTTLKETTFSRRDLTTILENIS